jgi:group I intron endonuclease
MAVVYLHRRMDTNEVFYVGIGMYKKRAYDKNKRNRLWKNVVNKCKDYEVEILHENITYQECKLIEIDLIDKYGRKDLGTGTLCNLTDGGDGTVGWIVSDETRRKISEGKTGEKHYFYGKTHSDETLRKMSERKTGEKHPMFGKTPSEETRRKMSEAQKGKKHSEESLKKMRESAKGRKLSEETIRKMRETRRKNKENLDN